MKKIFIYYSLTNNGDIVANYLKDKKIELRKVVSKRKLPSNRILQIITGGFLAGIHYKDELLSFNPNISEYDEVIIGSPIWNSNLSCPINSVLDKIDLHNKKIIFILYSASGNALKATAYLKNKYPSAQIISLKEPRKNQVDMKEALNKL